MENNKLYHSLDDILNSAARNVGVENIRHFINKNNIDIVDKLFVYLVLPLLDDYFSYIQKGECWRSEYRNRFDQQGITAHIVYCVDTYQHKFIVICDTKSDLMRLKLTYG